MVDDQGFFEKLRDVIRNIINDVKESDIIASSGVFISLFFTIVSICMSIFYLISAVSTYTHNVLIKNIVNIDSLDYKVSKTFNSVISTGYNYKFFLILPWLQILPIIAILTIKYIRERREPPKELIIGTSLVVMMCILIIQGAISLIFNSIFYFYGSKDLSPINQRIKHFNSYIHRNLFKSSNIFKFYEPLREVQSISMVNTLLSVAKKSLSTLPSNITAEELAKAFFSINMYIHFHKLGSKNTKTSEALSLFHPTKLLLPYTFSPADYLYMKGTFIYDYSFKLGSQKSAYLPPEILNNKDIINKAVALNSQWIVEANNRANNIYADDATIPIFVMSYAIVVSQIVVLLVLWYILKDPKRRSALMRVLVP